MGSPAPPTFPVTPDRGPRSHCGVHGQGRPRGCPQEWFCLPGKCRGTFLSVTPLGGGPCSGQPAHRDRDHSVSGAMVPRLGLTQILQLWQKLERRLIDAQCEPNSNADPAIPCLSSISRIRPNLPCGLQPSSQSMAPEPAASPAPGSLLEMQSQVSPRPAESELAF